MIHSFHVILSTYGFWLPNDPRGSWSDFVASWELLRYGKATKVETTRSVAHAPHDRALRRAAKDALNFDPVNFSGRQALAVGHGFAKAVRESAYPIHAACVLPDHVHLVVGRVERDVSKVVSHLKARATQALLGEGVYTPIAERVPDSPWARKYWKVFVDSPEWTRNAIRYVENNPVKEGKLVQEWSFVRPYLG